jgi:hypothetical protein
MREPANSTKIEEVQKIQISGGERNGRKELKKGEESLFSFHDLWDKLTYNNEKYNKTMRKKMNE